ncbi:Bacterial extracellular solute-binding protein, family 7 [Aquimixticola soesokkakensis]|uniref:Bacterial extracellular solute-binding protein, family 7 n=1 Tax=Aquimixticola soesokkakensis TaxID=1519096 RepID=A0A1Y5RWG0_9RHOB|nr:TRAP transporter substrate-binding protein DctP [Aquimixticola soesokkakensis]SLN26788.1 Bacterial extracellular solute-binding protein, family 7 [Aquimixticola soesokkakensis]
MNHFRTLTAATVVAMGSFSAAPVFAQTDLIFNSYLPPFNASRKAALTDFAAEIEAQSGGEVTITIPDSTLAPSDQQYEMLLDGVADMAFLATDDLSQLVALNGIADLPGNAPSARAASVALWETYREMFKSAGEYKGVVLLSTHVLPGRQIMGLDDPIDSAESARGAKFWVPNGPLTDVISSLDAVPVHTNFPEVFETVSKGLVDALVMTPGSAEAAKVLERTKYYTTVPGGLGSVSFAVAISEERWNALGAEEQAAVLRAADGLPGRTGSALDAADAQADMSGLTVLQSPANLLEALTPEMEAQIAGWKERATAKGIDADAALAFYRSVLARETGAN